MILFKENPYYQSYERSQNRKSKTQTYKIERKTEETHADLTN